jgi:hypothetical protein
MTRHATIAAGLILGSALFAAPALAQQQASTLLGLSKNWAAYESGTGSDKVCYALSQPKAQSPKKAKRDTVAFLISDWPARKARAEPEIDSGYKYKDGSTVTAAMGADKYVFFTNNDGDAGTAWLKSTLDEERLIESMQRANQLIVTGISARGTMTRDTYSLDGLSDALTKIHTACNM